MWTSGCQDPEGEAELERVERVGFEVQIYDLSSWEKGYDERLWYLIWMTEWLMYLLCTYFFLCVLIIVSFFDFHVNCAVDRSFLQIFWNLLFHSCPLALQNDSPSTFLIVSSMFAFYFYVLPATGLFMQLCWFRVSYMLKFDLQKKQDGVLAHTSLKCNYYSNRVEIKSTSAVERCKLQPLNLRHICLEDSRHDFVLYGRIYAHTTSIPKSLILTICNRRESCVPHNIARKAFTSSEYNRSY